MRPVQTLRPVELTRGDFPAYARQMVNTWKSASEHLLQTDQADGKRIRSPPPAHNGTYIIPSFDLPVLASLSLHNSDQPHPVHAAPYIRCDWEISSWVLFVPCLSGYGRALLRAADEDLLCWWSIPSTRGRGKRDSLKKSRKKPC